LIRQSVASVAGGTVVKDTTTHAARRIALDAATLAAPRARRERAEALARACRRELGPDAFVFSAAPDGSAPLHPTRSTTSFQRLCRRLGLTGVRLGTCRAGVPGRAVSGRLGHGNAATTLNVYAPSSRPASRRFSHPAPRGPRSGRGW
jgi:hypothetical protein